jgi:hypothetical protein
VSKSVRISRVASILQAGGRTVTLVCRAEEMGRPFHARNALWRLTFAADCGLPNEQEAKIRRRVLDNRSKTPPPRVGGRARPTGRLPHRATTDSRSPGRPYPVAPPRPSCVPDSPGMRGSPGESTPLKPPPGGLRISPRVRSVRVLVFIAGICLRAGGFTPLTRPVAPFFHPLPWCILRMRRRLYPISHAWGISFLRRTCI